jgi:hypothetical protein
MLKQVVRMEPMGFKGINLFEHENEMGAIRHNLTDRIRRTNIDDV